MRSILILSSLFIILNQSANASLYENDCVTELVPANVSEMAGVFMRMRTEVANLYMGGTPSVGSVMQCELGQNTTLYVVEGRLHAGCFLGNRYKLMVKELTPQRAIDNFKHEIEFIEMNER